MGEWKTKSQKYVYENPWIRVREDAVVRPDGNDGIYAVVEANDGNGIVLVNEKDEIYIRKQFRYIFNEYHLEIPAGTMEDGEDRLEAAKRELLEESGCSADDWIYLGGAALSNGRTNEGSHFYLARKVTHHDNAPVDENEIVSDSGWVHKDELYRMLDAGELNNSYIIIGLALARHLLY